MPELHGDVLPVGVPSSNGMGLLHSMIEMFRLISVLKRPVHHLIGEAGNIPKSRNKVLELLRTQYGNEKRHVLWWDTDIYIPTDMHKEIAKMIIWADTNNKAVCANYKMVTGQNVVMDADGHHYTDEDINAMSTFNRIGLAGMGLCYIPMDPEYVFHADTVGEDIHFFRDNPDIDLYLAKDVKLAHLKQVALRVGGFQP